MLQDVPRFVGADMHNYGPFREGDVANIPEANARLLLERGMARKMECA
jgi:DNA replication initiation complex subunit (GINS family)